MQKVFCYGCEQTKSRMAFSISQLNKMVATKGAPQRALRYEGGTGKAAHQPLCKTCTPAEVTMLKCTNCSRTRLLEMFSKSQRRRQKDGRLICMECRKELDAEEVVVWSEDEEDCEEEDGGCGDGFKSMFGGGGGGGFEESKPDWTVKVENGDPDWDNGTLNDMFL
ncbi:hypothetical protein BGZ96_008124 [Linnemannia gamsii]|uniref:Stc1 domain-containing protein n=1 Tax=Linnemannia gamsii TaxID=64522 RepID=A0ABQ7KDI9_9FUNG|nr:hypothetical protein BGZ96_008124 [Linnemannia gamsii]